MALESFVTDIFHCKTLNPKKNTLILKIFSAIKELAVQMIHEKPVSLPSK
ncbi:hypothetical protein FOLKNPGA_03648 (plasmid) [Legionella sp. PC1000]|nr:hypothetical protein FOLKNPGA_03648 [Legionella sp. PC1000]